MFFILASSSPRRKDLLENAGYQFEIHHVDYIEQPYPDEPPSVYAHRTACEKATSARHQYPHCSWILTADTVVEIDGQPLGKPKDNEEARQMLQALSGKTHQVHTGVCLNGRDGTSHTLVITSKVTFRTLSHQEIDEYIATGEPFDKAGAYGIQGQGQKLVAQLDGSLSNVIGLPMEEVETMLTQAGLLPIYGDHSLV